MAINHYLSCVGHRIWYCDKDVIPINITLRTHNQTDNNKTAARLPTIPSSTASTDCGQSVYQGEWCFLWRIMILFDWVCLTFHLSPGSAGSATHVYQTFDWSDQLRPNAFQRELNIINGTKWFSWSFYFIKSTVKLILVLGLSTNKTRLY